MNGQEKAKEDDSHIHGGGEDLSARKSSYEVRYLKDDKQQALLSLLFFEQNQGQEEQGPALQGR